MSAVADLIERAVSDLQQGWHEAALDALGRAIRASEAARWIAVEQRLASLEEWRGRVVSEMAGIVSDVDARLRALEQRGLNPKLAELNEFRRSEAKRLDDEIKAILAATPGWPRAKQVRRALQSAAFHPAPSIVTVRRHLRALRGKQSRTVMSHSEASAPITRGTIAT